jgi:hypothetical protein
VKGLLINTTSNEAVLHELDFELPGLIDQLPAVGGTVVGTAVMVVAITGETVLFLWWW